jgi:hypothetical protein
MMNYMKSDVVPQKQQQRPPEEQNEKKIKGGNIVSQQMAVR